MDTINNYLKKFSLDNELYNYILNLDVMSLQISALDNFCAEDNFQYVKDIDFSLLDRKEKHVIKVGLKKYIKLLKKLKKTNDFLAYKEFDEGDNIIIKPFIMDKNFKGCHYILKMNKTSLYIELYDDEDSVMVFSVYYEEGYFKLIFRDNVFIKDHDKVYYKGKEYIDKNDNFIEYRNYDNYQILNQLIDLGDDKISKLTNIGNPLKTLNSLYVENHQFDFTIFTEFNGIIEVIKFNIFTDNFFIVRDDVILRYKNYKLKYKNLIDE